MGGTDYSFEVEISSDAVAVTGCDPEYEGEDNPLKEVVWMSLDEISEKDRSQLPAHFYVDNVQVCKEKQKNKKRG